MLDSWKGSLLERRNGLEELKEQFYVEVEWWGLLARSRVV